MNGVALLVALATVGVDYSWRKTEDGLGEYTLQIEPEFRDALISGEEITSDIPPEAESIDRICIRIGTTPVRHSAASVQHFKSLWATAGRYASTNPTVAGGDAQTTILWPSRTNPELTYGVSCGWQPDQNGKLAYYLQIDPTVLKTLAPGDEIHATIDPAAGKVGQFFVSAGTKQLPRVGGPPPVVTPQTVMQSPATLPSGSSSRSRFTTNDAGSSPAAGGTSTFGSSSRGSRDRDAGSLPATSPPLIAPRDDAGGYNSRFSSDSSPATTELRSPAYDLPSSPSYGSASGGLVDSPQSTTRFNDLRGSLQPPVEYQPPSIPQPTFVHPVGANQPQYAPPQQAPQYNLPPQYQPPPQYAQAPAYQPQPTTSYSPPATDRLASVPPPITTGATAPARAPALEVPAPVQPASSGSVTNGPTGTLWLVVVFALFLSIGGNAYLGWTAAEFYSRYRTAVDRLRSAARA